MERNGYGYQLDRTKPGHQRSRSLNLLIVDDDESSVMALSDTVKQRGHVVTIVDEAARCLTLCQQNTYDLIIMDYHMPGLEGDDAIKFIRQGPLRSVVVVFTGDRSQNCIKTFRELDVDVIMFKPAEIETIHSIIFHLENRTSIDYQFAHKLSRKDENIIFPHADRTHE